MKKEPVLFGVMGSPVGHSISPSIHSKFIENAGISAYYVPMSIEKKYLKDAILNANKLGFRGLNITIPYKEDVFKIIEEFGVNDVSAKYCQAVNTILYNDDRIYGYNTDGSGFIKSCEKYDIALEGKNIMIIGAGGASRGIIGAISNQKCENIFITNRSPDRLGEVKKIFPFINIVDFDKLNESINSVDMIINTTSVGMYDRDMLFDYSMIKKSHIIYDIVYKKVGTTQIIDTAKSIGAIAIDGIEMLHAQALEAFNLWTKDL
jgi:shikimate dehydrogenase